MTRKRRAEQGRDVNRHSQHFVIRAEHAGPIIAAQREWLRDVLARLSDLAGVPVRNFSRAGNFAFGFAHPVGVHLDPEQQPLKPGWRAGDEAGYWEPNPKVKAGRVLREVLHGMDALGFLGVLRGAGVSPWPDTGDAFKAYVCGAGVVGDQILLVCDEEWVPRLSWPEWVEPIKASEFYRIQEENDAALRAEGGAGQ